jgi:cyclopropane-fatty-acyl-phospholipid synthase
MNRTRIDPLGVPDSGYGYTRSDGGNASSLDRWLVRQITSRLGTSPVRIVLWDEPDITPRDDTIVMRIGDRGALWQLAVNPNLHFGDLYSAGRIELRGSLLRTLEEAYRYTRNTTTIGALIARTRRLAPDLSESKRNIHHHYDIGNEFYKLWLDREALQYTCAYYADPAMTIEQAQQAKMHHVCRKLRLVGGRGPLPWATLRDATVASGLRLPASLLYPEHDTSRVYESLAQSLLARGRSQGGVDVRPR